jgi:hypothetical protein
MTRTYRALGAISLGLYLAFAEVAAANAVDAAVPFLSWIT